MDDEPQDYTLEMRFNLYGTLSDVENYIRDILTDFEEGYVSTIFDEQWEEVQRLDEVENSN